MYKENENNNEDNSIIQNADIIPSVISNALNEIPDEEAKEKVKKSILMSISAFNMVGKPSTPFDKVFTKEHCTQFLQNMEESDKREFDYKKNDRKYAFCTICVGLIFAFFIVQLLLKYDKADLINVIMTHLAAVIGGGGIGYGIGRSKKTKIKRENFEEAIEKAKDIVRVH